MIQLYDHQKRALNYMRIYDSFALFMEQGTGKTYPTVMRLNELYKIGEIESALIVCPKATIRGWEETINTVNPELLDITYIINYESVWRGEYGYRWDAIVLDEAHRIKDRKSKQSQYVVKLSEYAKYRYILTGTPITNGALENYFALFLFLSPINTGRSYKGQPIYEVGILDGMTWSAFLKEYCLLDKFHKPAAYRKINILQDRVNSYSYRVLKEECLDLPEKLPDEILYVENKNTKPYYEMLSESVFSDYDYIAKNSLVRMLKLRQLCSGYLETKTETVQVKCEKQQALKEAIEDLGDKKVVVFAEFKNSIQDIEQVAKDLKRQYIILDGDQKDKGIWKQFQANENIKMAICQYQSACEGIDLYSADTMFFYEPTLSSNVLEQAKDRIHRIGQKEKCSYIHLITERTIEERIYKTLKSYQDFNTALFEEYIETMQKSMKEGVRYA